MAHVESASRLFAEAAVRLKATPHLSRRVAQDAARADVLRTMTQRKE